METQSNTPQVETPMQMGPMTLNRRQRRLMLKRRGLLKYISRLNFLGEIRTSVREENRANGQKLHNMHLDAVEKAQSIFLEEKLKNLKETWANIGYNETEISMLEEAWALMAVKSRETYREDKKRSRELTTEAQKSFQDRTK